MVFWAPAVTTDCEARYNQQLEWLLRLGQKGRTIWDTNLIYPHMVTAPLWGWACEPHARGAMAPHLLDDFCELMT
jgi:hypothetical protein